MNKQVFIAGILAGLSLMISGCSPTENSLSEREQAEEFIILSINEMVLYEFYKQDETWSASLTKYTLGPEGGKKIKSKYHIKDRDSLREFGMLVDFLDLYHISPQHEIKDWVPDNNMLPKKVYSFEVSEGEGSRSYSYQDPIDRLNDFWQAQHILTFVTFIEDEMTWVKSEI